MGTTSKGGKLGIKGRSSKYNKEYTYKTEGKLQCNCGRFTRRFLIGTLTCIKCVNKNLKARGVKK